MTRSFDRTSRGRLLSRQAGTMPIVTTASTTATMPPHVTTGSNQSSRSGAIAVAKPRGMIALIGVATAAAISAPIRASTITWATPCAMS